MHWRYKEGANAVASARNCERGEADERLRLADDKSRPLKLALKFLHGKFIRGRPRSGRRGQTGDRQAAFPCKRKKGAWVEWVVSGLWIALSSARRHAEGPATAPSGSGGKRRTQFGSLNSPALGRSFPHQFQRRQTHKQRVALYKNTSSQVNITRFCSTAEKANGGEIGIQNSKKLGEGWWRSDGTRAVNLPIVTQ